MDKSLKELFDELGVTKLRDAKVLNGETNLLNGQSVYPLLQLMRAQSIEELHDKSRGWSLGSDGSFRNPVSPHQKVGHVTELKNKGDVFWSQNTSINPHYIGPKRGVTYIDQFDNLPPGVVERLRTEYPRDPEVRKKVLIRAAGHCELCGEEGFRTANGEIFLESHHVQPLSEQGQDCEWNVVALCPNDHRKSHHADNNRVIRAELEVRLKFLQQNAH